MDSPQDRPTRDGTRAAVVVVVVAYNSREHIGPCLDSVLHQDVAARLVVLDNASTDGTADWVEQAYPGVDVLRSPDNLGFGRACNRAVHQADEDFVLLLNPDAVLRPGALRELLEAVPRWPSAAIWGARIETPDGALDPSCCMGRKSLWSTFCFATGMSSAFPGNPVLDPESLGRWARDDERVVPVVSGAVMLVRRSVWDALAGFDERYFMYGEDVDLCARAAERGWASVLVPTAVAMHVDGGSSTGSGKLVLRLKGDVTLLQQSLPRWQRPLARRLLHSGVALRAALPGVAALLPATRPRTTSSAWSGAWDRRVEWSRGWEGRSARS